jgi:hypothetical protein
VEDVRQEQQDDEEALIFVVPIAKDGRSAGQAERSPF